MKLKKMVKRLFIPVLLLAMLSVLLLSLLSVLPLWSAVEQPYIVILKNKDIEPYTAAIQGFTEALNRLKTKPLFKEYDYNAQRDGMDERMVAAIKSQNPDIIFTMGTSVAQYVSARIKMIPIVFSMVVDPLGSGLKADNLTGVTLEIPAVLHLEILKQCLPMLKTVGVLYNPDENEMTIVQAHAAATSLGLRLKSVAVKNPKEIPDIENMDIDALLIIPDNTVCQPSIIQRLLLSGLKNKIPVMGISSSYAKAGALLALSCHYKDIGRQAGEMAEKILRGEKCINLKIVAPREIKLFLNLAVAERLGIKIPEALIKKAEQVFGK